MRSIRVMKSVMATVATVVLLLGTLVLTGTTAEAQRVFVRPHVRVFVGPRPFFHSGFYGYPYYGPYYRVYDPIAYQREQGYSDGLSRGKSDAKHGKADDPNSHKHYRDSSSVTYREAFLQGYNDGFNRTRG